MSGPDSSRGQAAQPAVGAAAGRADSRSAGHPVPGQAEPVRGERRPGVLREILGNDLPDDDRPLPDLPPLPADPRWRIEHLPMVTAAGVALVLSAASAGFLLGGPTAALGAAAGVFIVTVSFTMSTLAVAWADVLRPALVLPVGLLAYVIKYMVIAFIMIAVAANGWPGGIPMAWGIVGGVLSLTAVQVWWVSRLARRNLPPPRPGSP